MLSGLQPVECVLKHSDGSTDTLTLNHSMNNAQIEWFHAGSALNRMKEAQVWNDLIRF